MVSSQAARLLGISPFTESSRVELRPQIEEGDVEAVVAAAYRQVFGNEHIMETERLASAESLLRQRAITVRGFIRALAYSELYRTKFFYSTPQDRFIELNYKHLLGRAPYDASEIADHVNLFHQQGYESEIDSYLDSQEYQDSFGEAIVPYYRGFESQRSQKVVGFSRMFRLYRGYANSDRSQYQGSRSHLAYELGRNTATSVRSQGVGAAIAGTTAVGQAGLSKQLYRLQVTRASKSTGPRVRQTISEYLVPFEQLSATLQKLGQKGDRVTNITPA